MKTTTWILSVTLLTGCAGGRCLVTARTIQPPVSFTSCVLDSDGEVRCAQQNEVVRHFVLTKQNWSMFYTLLPLGQKEWDISQELNAKIQESAGNAAVNVTVQARGQPLLWYFGALVPIIPAYVDVKVEGDIARFSDLKAVPPPPATPSPPPPPSAQLQQKPEPVSWYRRLW